MITIHIVRKNADSTEGSGPMVPIKYITDYEAAVAYVEAQPDPYGRVRSWNANRYGDLSLEEVPVFESLDEIDDYAAIDIKAQALAKLTEQEKRALGF
jgi:hypothetical protein